VKDGSTAGESAPIILEVVDERGPEAGAALALISATFPRQARQPLTELRSEIAEKRLDLLAAMDFHLLVALGESGEVMATVAGIYLEGVNAGYVTYLAVDSRFRGLGLAPRLRSRLVELFRGDARRAGFEDLAWVVGEVRVDRPWLRSLLQTGNAVAFDLPYHIPGTVPPPDGSGAVRPGAHASGSSRPGSPDPASGRPGPPGEAEPPPEPARYVLYREPVGDLRRELPVSLVRRVLYSIYRRGYRVRYPLDLPPFRAMLEALNGRETVGPAHLELDGADSPPD
jgi:GNAT superfamily N-acetyltransferase